MTLSISPAIKLKAKFIKIGLKQYRGKVMENTPKKHFVMLMVAYAQRVHRTLFGEWILFSLSLDIPSNRITSQVPVCHDNYVEPKQPLSEIELKCTNERKRSVRPALGLPNLLHHIPHSFKPLHAQSLLYVFGINGLRRIGDQEHAGVPIMKRQPAMHHESATHYHSLRLAVKACLSSARTRPAQSRGIAKAAVDTGIFALFFHVRNTSVYFRESFERLVGNHGYRFETKTHPSPHIPQSIGGLHQSEYS